MPHGTVHVSPRPHARTCDSSCWQKPTGIRHSHVNLANISLSSFASFARHGRYVNAWPVDWRGEMHLLPGETLEAERDRRLAVFESGLAFQPNGERARDMLRAAASADAARAAAARR
jgi:hypothetical protein